MVPHFPQQDHVRRLPQASPQGGQVIHRVDGNLPLADDAPLIPVEVLDGVLQGDDVGLPGAVDAVDDAGLGGGFAAAGGTGDQHHSGRDIRQIHDQGGDPDGLPVRNVEGYQPNDQSHRAALPVGIYPETCQTRDGE